MHFEHSFLCACIFHIWKLRSPAATNPIELGLSTAGRSHRAVSFLGPLASSIAIPEGGAIRPGLDFLQELFSAAECSGRPRVVRLGK
jgi:hypothetical protein